MRRAQRLFQIIQILRTGRGPVTAERLAAEVETSRRTIYRDLAALMAERVPIRGEAGVGYVLDDGFDLPPLMLTADEVEALALGVHWVAGHGDPQLAKAAVALRSKIVAAVPEPLKKIIEQPAVQASSVEVPFAEGADLAVLRKAIHAGRKISIGYVDAQGAATRRTVWPFLIGYFEGIRLLAAWCESRADFRNFRTDRITRIEVLDEHFAVAPPVLLARWRATLDRSGPQQGGGPDPRQGQG